jgi:fumarylacetoacetase
MLDETHDPAARSWLVSANAADTDFPIQNLPFGIFCAPGLPDARGGVAIGDQVLDITACWQRAAFDGLPVDAARACGGPSLNAFMAMGRPAWRALRARVSALLRAGHPQEARHREIVSACLRPMREVTLRRPAAIGQFTDFYASIHHATNMGRMFRPDAPLLPNYKYVPIGYHGRASSIVCSGRTIVRPSGQVKPADGPPVYQATARLDYELELGFFIGPGNPLASIVPIDKAAETIFGVCLVNDWSARDIQPWEYQPLGPFLSKSFATTISPWVVTMEALEPYRVAAMARAADDPAPLPYLTGAADQASGGIDIALEVWVQSARMRDEGVAPVRLARSRTSDLYWTLAQMVAHHTSNGCNLQPGDLLASGTVSGPDDESLGSLMELTRRGERPITLPTGETRRFLEDGDEVILKGAAQRDGYPRIGLGECRGIIGPSVAASTRAE